MGEGLVPVTCVRTQVRSDPGAVPRPLSPHLSVLPRAPWPVGCLGARTPTGGSGLGERPVLTSSRPCVAASPGPPPGRTAT